MCYVPWVQTGYNSLGNKFVSREVSWVGGGDMGIWKESTRIFPLGQRCLSKVSVGCVFIGLFWFLPLPCLFVWDLSVLFAGGGGRGGAQDGIRSCGLLHLPFHRIPVVSTRKESRGVKREI